MKTMWYTKLNAQKRIAIKRTLGKQEGESSRE